MRLSGRRLVVLSFASLAALGQADCSPRVSPEASGAEPGKGPGATVFEIIEADPQFRNYALVTRAVGLGPMLRSAGNVTIFAPVNSAFDGTAWADVVNPDLSSTGGASAFQRQRLVEASVVDGVHTPAELAGKRQNVRTMGGMVFELDGTDPGHMMASVPKPSSPTGIGFGPASATPTARLGSPIRASNGIIYPVDRILVHSS